jgi:predicted amidohydrolase YtcJ
VSGSAHAPSGAGRHVVGVTTSDEPLLLVGGEVRTLDERMPTARAVLIRHRRIAWVGDDSAAVASSGCRTIDLDGAVVQPAFVNAHTHLTNVGLMLSALDLSLARSVQDCLAVLRATVDVTPDPIIWGVGWDETGWPEHRAPTADELSEAASGRPVILSRADGHCVVVDRTTLSAAPLARSRGVERGEGGAPNGLLRQEAAQVAQSWFAAQVPSSTLDLARETAARQLAASGVASAHEMGGPHRMGADDFDAWLEGEWPLEVLPYWGDLDLEFVMERGLRRVGGSLLLDGTIGSHSAALTVPYADRHSSGQLYHDTTELVQFALDATRKGVQVAFHAIGDRAVAQAIEVFESVAEIVGPEQLRRSHHRLEYAVLVGAADIARLAPLGVVVTVQPASDLELAALGGSYEQRLGTERARAANPLGALVRAGVPLAFGNDAAHALEPWRGVESASHHAHPSSSMEADAALRAATIGGRVAARQPNVGRIGVGQRADLAAFEGEGSTRRCVLTVVAGAITHGGPGA